MIGTDRANPLPLLLPAIDLLQQCASALDAAWKSVERDGKERR